ncbi:MAG: enoyl-CoA hydratase/isomerase family protein [Cyanobacteria bacterium NC_groundwater_1444_Ag_S-0.65um_54_12]|nr:enoyl-CoA hydratase/isomerase family protein [Cyanobacteria bacterium NC_groundwater_1444_Ag_S-0.65um_54_12]
MVSTRLSLQRAGQFALLTLTDASGLNILDRRLLTEFSQLLAELARDPALAILLLTGAGSKAFSAGANLKELAELDTAAAWEFSRLGQELTTSIWNFPCPVIAMINGICFGGGLELATACDFRIASEHATFSYPASRLGILPGFGGTQRCPMLIGLARASELMLFGRVIPAATALSWGLVNAVVAAAELSTVAWRWASELAQRDAHAIRQTRACLRRMAENDFLHERAAFAACFSQPDVKAKLQQWRRLIIPDAKEQQNIS